MLTLLSVLSTCATFGAAIDLAFAEFNVVYFGPDGPWPAAYISLGSPPQRVSLTPSTNIEGIWSLLPESCAGNQLCLDGRGGPFTIEESSTWTSFSRSSDVSTDITSAPLLNGQPYGITATGLHGSDIASIGSVELSSISVVAVSSTSVNNGYLGLRNVTWEMYLQGQIPSPSWSYHVGAGIISRHPMLAFGGYDAAQSMAGTYQSHPLIASPDGVPSMELVLDLLTLNMTGKRNGAIQRANSSLLDGPISVTIDSTTPFCWLPKNITDSIADAVGAVWNETIGYYIYNTNATGYVNMNITTLTFHFADSSPSSLLFNSVSLSHNLILAPPVVTSNLQYLPMQPVTRGNSYVLGRSFLQQIYTIVDYLNSNFTISQVDLNPEISHSYVTIAAPSIFPEPTTKSNLDNSTTTDTTTGEPSSKPGSSGNLSRGAIGGIVVGSIGGVCLIVAISFLIYRRKKKGILYGSSGDIPKPPVYVAPEQVGWTPSLPELEHGHGYSVDVSHRVELDASAGPRDSAPSELPTPIHQI